jgi:hypothetical protein
VPVNVPTDPTHFHSLTSAIPAAGTGGTVTIESGASPDPGGVNVNLNNLTIQGDPSVPGNTLPMYDLNVSGSQVSLDNLSLGTVIVDGNHVSVTRSQLVNFIEDGAVSGAGHNVLSQDFITNTVDLEGNCGPSQNTSDLVANNTFSSSASIVLKLTNSNGTTVRDNTIIDNASSAYGIEVPSNGGTGVVDVSAALDPNHAFVQTLYRNLLGRTGASAEIDSWVSVLPTLGQAGVAHGILHSSESLDRIVKSDYIRFLGREANGSEELGFVNALQSGVLTLEQVQAGLVASLEYQGHHNTWYVQSLYLNVLHRTGSGTDVAGWNGQLPQLGPSGVALDFTTGPENRHNEATADIQDLLARPPQPGEVDQLMSQPGGLLGLKLSVLSGADYFAHG